MAVAYHGIVFNELMFTKECIKNLFHLQFDIYFELKVHHFFYPQNIQVL